MIKLISKVRIFRKKKQFLHIEISILTNQVSKIVLSKKENSETKGRERKRIQKKASFIYCLIFSFLIFV